ncbi:hypothetical protein [Nocardia concava]|uniref:hypothetical protein n=1 Tax=Nocardia concava TaxID=257281 RepID=UPI001FDF5419|nr:hypothetical protein [Nocardia concava]
MEDDQMDAEGKHSEMRHETEKDLAARADMCELATPAETARFLRTTVGKLANDRHLGIGPRYMKYGRSVLYPWRSLRAFIDENMTGDL